MVMPEGVVMVLDLLIVAWFFDIVDVLLKPAGLVEVVVRVVVVAGACDILVVVILLVLLLMVLAAGVVWAWATRPPVTSKAERRPKKRFIGMEKNG